VKKRPGDLVTAGDHTAAGGDRRRRLVRGRTQQEVAARQRFAQLRTEERSCSRGALLDRGGDEAGRQETTPRALVVLRGPCPEPAMMHAGAVRVGQRHEDRARARQQGQRDLLDRRAQSLETPRRFQDRRLHFGVGFGP